MGKKLKHAKAKAEAILDLYPDKDNSDAINPNTVRLVRVKRKPLIVRNKNNQVILQVTMAGEFACGVVFNPEVKLAVDGNVIHIRLPGKKKSKTEVDLPQPPE